jgi:predicted RNA binding protein YcfA (HicA-like mRNA interferase family)
MLPKEIVRYLEKNGFGFIKSNGSHRKYYNPTTGKTTVVPYHDKPLKPGTEKAILKQAGLDKPR